MEETLTNGHDLNGANGLAKPPTSPTAKAICSKAAASEPKPKRRQPASARGNGYEPSRAELKEARTQIEGINELFNVILLASGDRKIEVIKVVRNWTRHELKDVKELLAKTPVEIDNDVPKGEAELMKEALEEAGASVELKVSAPGETKPKRRAKADAGASGATGESAESKGSESESAPKPEQSKPSLGELISNLEDEQSCSEEIGRDLALSHLECRSACLAAINLIRSSNWDSEGDCLVDSSAEIQKPILAQVHCFWDRFYAAADYFWRLRPRILDAVVKLGTSDSQALAQIGAVLGELTELTSGMSSPKVMIELNRPEYFAAAALELLPEATQLASILAAITTLTALIKREVRG